MLQQQEAAAAAVVDLLRAETKELAEAAVLDCWGRGQTAQLDLLVLQARLAAAADQVARAVELEHGTKALAKIREEQAALMEEEGVVLMERDLVIPMALEP